VVLDCALGTVRVMGRGGATVRRGGEEHVFPDGASVPLEVLGPVRMPAPDEGLPREVVEAVLGAEALPPEVAALIEEREAARRAQDWARADALRERLAGLGYVAEDTAEGPR
jgi:hypothetical protein